MKVGAGLGTCFNVELPVRQMRPRAQWHALRDKRRGGGVQGRNVGPASERGEGDVTRFVGAGDLARRWGGGRVARDQSCTVSVVGFARGFTLVPGLRPKDMSLAIRDRDCE